MYLKQHCAVSGAVAAVAYLATRDAATALVTLAAGILIDVDHVPDYLLHAGKKASVKGFFEDCEASRLKRYYLALHSYEIVPVIILLGLLTNHTMLSTAAAVAFLIHILCDQIYNPVVHRAYFFFYRLKNGFAVEKIVDPARLRTK